jgi:hypothetical protein
MARWKDYGRLNVGTELMESRWEFAVGQGHLEDTIAAWDEGYPGSRGLAKMYLAYTETKWRPNGGVNFAACALACLNFGTDGFNITGINFLGKPSGPRPKTGLGLSATAWFGQPQQGDTISLYGCNGACLGGYLNPGGESFKGGGTIVGVGTPGVFLGVDIVELLKDLSAELLS